MTCRGRCFAVEVNDNGISVINDLHVGCDGWCRKYSPTTTNVQLGREIECN